MFHTQNIIKVSMGVIIVFVFLVSFSMADRPIFGGFESPLSGLTASIAGAGTGTISAGLDTTQKYSGSSSLKWRYVNPSGAGDNYPQMVG